MNFQDKILKNRDIIALHVLAVKKLPRVAFVYNGPKRDGTSS